MYSTELLPKPYQSHNHNRGLPLQQAISLLLHFRVNHQVYFPLVSPPATMTSKHAKSTIEYSRGIVVNAISSTTT